MKILVTGGSGYLGSVLVPDLLACGHEIIVYDNLLYDQMSLLNLFKNKNFEFVYGDVRDYSKLTKYVNKSDVIIPLAAIVGFPACDRDKQLATAVNYYQIKDILKNTSKDQRIVFPNTNSGYGHKTEGVCTEDQKLTPISHYGVTKCDSENLLLDSGRAITLRLATVFGMSERMRLDLLVNEFVYKALTDRYITLFQAAAVRNYIHISDVAFTFKFMIDNYEDNVGEAFNVGLSDTNISKKELTDRIIKHIPDFVVNLSDYYEDPDKRDYIVSNEKIESRGWKPKYSLDDGIKELIDGYQIIINKDSSYFRNGFPLSYGVTL
jgi:nucleoside-diphosphate-sugar epimerase